MSEAKLLSTKGRSTGKIELPKVFDTPYRPDLIKRAVIAEQSRNRQPKGRSPMAARLVAETATRPGRGISLVPRTHGQRTHHGNRATFIPSTVGGRLAFPPTTEKKIVEKINKKELKLALWSAVSATTKKELSSKRGHLMDEKREFPIVVKDDLLELSKTSEVIEAIEKLGLGDDLQRTKIKKVRPGKGKRRGRKYRKKTGPLVIIPNESEGFPAAKNIAGVTVLRLKDLSVEALAPGTEAGRATIWLEGALKDMEAWK